MTLALILGILANLIFVMGNFFRLPQYSIFFAMIGNITYVIYYFVIDLHTPMNSVLIGAVTSLIILKVTDYRYINYVAIGSLILLSSIILHQMNAPIDFLIMMAAACICYAQMNKNCYKRYKYGVIASQILWILYCLEMSEFAMLATSTMILISASGSLYYNIIKDKKLSRIPVRQSQYS